MQAAEAWSSVEAFDDAISVTMADVLATQSARLTMIVGTTAVFLGLAVLGQGGFSAFFSHPAPSALALATLAMSAVAFSAGGTLRTGVREDRANRWVIAAFGVGGLASVEVSRPLAQLRKHPIGVKPWGVRLDAPALPPRARRVPQSL